MVTRSKNIDKCWRQINVGSGIMFEGRTDFQKGTPYQPTYVSYYRKGFFRGKENEHVIKIHDKLREVGGDKIHGFGTKVQALKFAKKYMKQQCPR